MSDLEAHLSNLRIFARDVSFKKKFCINFLENPKQLKRNMIMAMESIKIKVKNILLVLSKCLDQ